jgi:hypothetical protein
MAGGSDSRRRCSSDAIQRRVDRACLRAKAALQEVITGVSSQNVKLDELYSFAGAKHPDEQESDLDKVGRHWARCAMARKVWFVERQEARASRGPE